MNTKEELTGRRFHRLTVMRYLYSQKGQRIWECICTCGNIIAASTHNLKSGNTKSCGCIQKEKATAHLMKISVTHGLSKIKGKRTRLFGIWSGMRIRCNDANDKAYLNYGGRGISICKEWEDFKNFHDWAISNGYNEDLTIERINVNGNYEPQNCKWIPRSQQALNRRNSRYITYNGETKILSQFAKDYGLSVQCLFRRLKAGWSIEKALTTKVIYN